MSDLVSFQALDRIADGLKVYNPDQPRDDAGEWTSVGGEHSAGDISVSDATTQAFSDYAESSGADLSKTADAVADAKEEREQAQSDLDQANSDHGTAQDAYADAPVSDDEAERDALDEAGSASHEAIVQYHDAVSRELAATEAHAAALREHLVMLRGGMAKMEASVDEDDDGPE